MLNAHAIFGLEGTLQELNCSIENWVFPTNLVILLKFHVRLTTWRCYVLKAKKTSFTESERYIKGPKKSIHKHYNLAA